MKDSRNCTVVLHGHSIDLRVVKESAKRYSVYRSQTLLGTIERRVIGAAIWVNKTAAKPVRGKAEDEASAFSALCHSALVVPLSKVDNKVLAKLASQFCTDTKDPDICSCVKTFISGDYRRSTRVLLERLLRPLCTHVNLCADGKDCLINFKLGNF